MLFDVRSKLMESARAEERHRKKIATANRDFAVQARISVLQMERRRAV
jgi:hypothetical protein